MTESPRASHAAHAAALKEFQRAGGTQADIDRAIKRLSGIADVGVSPEKGHHESPALCGSRNMLTKPSEHTWKGCRHGEKNDNK